MVHHLVHFACFVAAVLLTAKIVPGIRVKSLGSAIFFSFVFALLDKLLFIPLVAASFPLVLISLGLFIVIINAFLFWLADKIVSGVEIDGFGTAILGSIVVSALNWGITHLLHIVF
jgi:putative membrane protein